MVQKPKLLSGFEPGSPCLQCRYANQYLTEEPIYTYLNSVLGGLQVETLASFTHRVALATEILQDDDVTVCVVAAWTRHVHVVQGEHLQVRGRLVVKGVDDAEHLPVLEVLDRSLDY